MKRIFFIAIAVLFIPHLTNGWEESYFRGLDDLIKQADYIVVTAGSTKERGSDGIEGWVCVFYYNLKGDAPLNKRLNVGVQTGDIPSFHNFQRNFCILFLNKRPETGFDFIVVGNQRSFLPAGSVKDFERAKDFSRLKGLSTKAAIEKLLRESIDYTKRSLDEFERDVFR